MAGKAGRRIIPKSGRMGARGNIMGGRIDGGGGKEVAVDRLRWEQADEKERPQKSPFAPVVPKSKGRRKLRFCLNEEMILSKNLQG